MSAGLSFFSSPLRPTSSSFLEKSQSRFLTPPHYQHHLPREQYQSSYCQQQQQSSTLHSVSSPTPTPLTTSRNANLMPERIFSLENNKCDGEYTENSDGLSAGVEVDKMITGATTAPATTSASSFSVPTSSAITATAASPSFFLGPPTTFSDVFTQSQRPTSRASQFQFEARACQSSSATQLQSHTAANRESRKRLFLDRLKTRRDDARAERNGDQLLRLDWMNERKAWEQSMARQCNEYQDTSGDFDGMILEEEQEQEENSSDIPFANIQGPSTSSSFLYQFEEMSPTEEKEIEDLVGYLENEHQYRNEDFLDSMDDGSDYDDLFMEVLNQVQQQQQQQQQQNQHQEQGLMKEQTQEQKQVIDDSIIGSITTVSDPDIDMS